MLIANAQIKVYAFVVPDCPICHYYLPLLHELAMAFESSSCEFNYIIPGNHLSKKEKNHYRNSIRKICWNKNEKVYNNQDSLIVQLNAQVTPEVFVLNSDKELVYSGAIDDKYFNISSYKQETENHYLKSVLTSLAENKKLTISRTEPVGCIITR